MINLAPAAHLFEVDERGRPPRLVSLDAARYRADEWVRGPFWWLGETSFWALFVHRVGVGGVARLPAAVRPLGRLAFRGVSKIMAGLTGVAISPDATIGPSLRIHHGRGLVIGAGVVVGAGCQLRHGVKLAALHAGAPAPVIGADAEIGSYAQVLGGVTLGDGARVGAHAVVVTDVPAGATAVGVPAVVRPARVSSLPVTP